MDLPAVHQEVDRLQVLWVQLVRRRGVARGSRSSILRVCCCHYGEDYRGQTVMGYPLCAFSQVRR